MFASRLSTFVLGDHSSVLRQSHPSPKESALHIGTTVCPSHRSYLDLAISAINSECKKLRIYENAARKLAKIVFFSGADQK